MFGKKKKKEEEGAEGEEKKEGADKKEDAKEEKGKEGEDAKEGEGAEGGEGEGAPKKSKKKLIIIAVIGLVVLIGGGVGAYFAFFHKPVEQAEGGEKGEGKGAAKASVYYTLPEFLVNLNSGGKQTSFLKATIVLELESSLDVMPLEGDLPKLLDSYNTYLRELRSSDLAGSAGIQRLREELLLRANKALAPIKINDVLFKEIIVQ
jgi:flagellar protein FliL